VDHRLDQEYLRSQAVNSEEGTPMGIGVWYEMRVGDPVARGERLAEIGKPADVHYTPQGSRVLADEVAKRIESALPQPR
jgi:hypothetical protein